MDNDPPQSSKRGRIMGKLFGGRERKTSNPDNLGDLNDFLRGSSDKLDVAHPGPPVLAKLDTLSAQRYPNALNVKSQSQQSLPIRTHSPRYRAKKNLVVRFVDTVPAIIGEGGDECETPPAEYGKRKPPPPAVPPRSPRRPPDTAPGIATLPPRSHAELTPPQGDGFTPIPMRRTQTGFSSIPEPPPQPPPDTRAVPAGKDTSARYLDSPVISKDENRRSFIELNRAQMREAEGLAFRAVRSSSGTGPATNDWDARSTPQSGASPEPKLRRLVDSPDSTEQRPRQHLPPLDASPSSTFSNGSLNNQSLGGSTKSYSRRLPDQADGSPTSPEKVSAGLHSVALAAGEEALKEFAIRTRHLFELFRLHSESVRPLVACPSDELARAALWWFLKGRMSLETAVRERPTSPQSNRTAEMLKQQAYADLAKGYWISEEVLPDLFRSRPSPLDKQAQEARRCLLSNLRKLSDSMKRNGFLPPEDAILPQTIDRTIWVEYPPVSQDIIALLRGQWGKSALAALQGSDSSIDVLDSFPLGDTTEDFSYGRVPANAILMEQGMESQQFFFPCLLSMVRPQKQSDLVFILASQNGAVQIKIQTANKNGAGPTFDNLRWRNETCTLEMRMPRGFMLAIRLSQTDYRILWNMYDFGGKVQATLYPRKDEHEMCRMTLKAFQYFDSDPQSRQFPKDAVPDCELAMFERISREAAATGPRNFHRGYRIAVITGPRTRTLSGVNHAFVPQMPVQFGFLRGEFETPALLLRFDNGRSKGSMVMSFKDEKERLELHTMLLGTKLLRDEGVFAQVSLVGFTISQRLADLDGIPCLKKLAWQRAQVINVEDENDTPTTVLAEKLRVVLEFQNGSFTDRMNIAPGEFRIRLDVNDVKKLSVLRPAQQDLTMAISEAQVPRDLNRELMDAQQVIQGSQTVRTYHFATLRDLHDFQAAITGHKVLFDGIAAAFAISRRRMVVPIHKKWEAGTTRIQIVQQDKVTQLLAFFADFHHGHCMGFVLKGTDVFEAISRSGKAGLKIDDAKFPLPRVAADGVPPTDDMSFVCLDLPDLPGEHDDITILFESETDRDQLITCLPAPVRNSRIVRKF